MDEDETGVGNQLMYLAEASRVERVLVDESLLSLPSQRCVHPQFKTLPDLVFELCAESYIGSGQAEVAERSDAFFVRASKPRGAPSSGGERELVPRSREGCCLRKPRHSIG